MMTPIIGIVVHQTKILGRLYRPWPTLKRPVNVICLPCTDWRCRSAWSLSWLFWYSLHAYYLHQTAPTFLAGEFDHQSSADEARQCLRSASTSSLVVPCTRLSTIGDRAFPVTTGWPWHTAAGIVNICFRKHLKTHLLSHSFPNLLYRPRLVRVQRLCYVRH